MCLKALIVRVGCHDGPYSRFQDNAETTTQSEKHLEGTVISYLTHGKQHDQTVCQLWFTPELWQGHLQWIQHKSVPDMRAGAASLKAKGMRVSLTLSPSIPPSIHNRSLLRWEECQANLCICPTAFARRAAFFMPVARRLRPAPLPLLPIGGYIYLYI